MHSRDSKLDQAPIGRGEPAGVEVEGPEMILEVDVHPLAPRPPSLFDGERDELGPDPAVPSSGRDHRVLDPRMHEAGPTER
jgi:hypothetical protein